MKAKLLIIDPQNDFCDIDDRCALPVIGANADMWRLSYFMEDVMSHLSDVVITLDTQESVAIERLTFWQTGEGGEVLPFTEITEAQVRAGEFLPRDIAKLPQVLAYLHALEAQGRYKLMVWTVHCVPGTFGHNLHEGVAEQVFRWEFLRQRAAYKVFKGMNPMTEQYSAIRAEVPNDDPRTQLNTDLVARCQPKSDELLIVAGEAASHCVPATMFHLYELINRQLYSNILLLSNCMSPVTGFQAQADQFFEKSAKLGVRVMTSDDALKLLAA